MTSAAGQLSPGPGGGRGGQPCSRSWPPLAFLVNTLINKKRKKSGHRQCGVNVDQGTRAKIPRLQRRRRLCIAIKS